jgi:uncharacterized protein with von Willebrand factor type A (vWA) domain
LLNVQTNRMLRIGIQGYEVPADERQDVALTFVIDVSGSMDMDNRLGLAKRALYLLVDQLRPTDRVAIVVYGSNARTVLDMTPVSEKQTILKHQSSGRRRFDQRRRRAVVGLSRGVGEFRPGSRQSCRAAFRRCGECRADRPR